MTLFARADVGAINSANCPSGGHVKKKGEHLLEINCPECESKLGSMKALFAGHRTMVPLTPEEEQEREQEDRDIALAMAAEGAAIRTQATDRIRKARATKAQAAEKSTRRRVVR